MRRTRNVKDGGIKAYCGVAKVGGKTWEKEGGVNAMRRRWRAGTRGVGAKKEKSRGRMEGRLSRAEKRASHVFGLRPLVFSSSPQRPITLCNMI